MATSAEQLKPGTLLNGRYQITRPLGRGGMGTVFLAEHLQLQSILAIKEVCNPGVTEEERQAALEQYQREARFLVQLNHANLPKVTDAFVENDRFYLVMEYIEGVTLEARLKERGGRPLPVIQVIEWGLQIADVLAYLHSQNPPIIFRDLKPANVMVKPDNTIRLIDFGIARRFQQGAMHDTSLFGSVGYSPPEQFGKQQTDTRSDIYAFGVTLHQMLTGVDPSVHPFKFAPVININRSVPELLSKLIQQCVEMDPEARPADVHQVAMGLVAARELRTSLEPEALEEIHAVAPVDALHAPTVGRSPSGPSGSGSGPKIISAKLAEAERRRSSQEMARPGSGRVAPPSAPSAPPPSQTPPASNRTPALVIGALLLLLAASGTAYVILGSHRANTSAVSHSTAKPVIPSTDPPPSIPSPTPPVTPVPANDDNQVTMNSLQVVTADIVALPDKTLGIRLTVKGAVTGKHTGKITLSGQFTDANNTPLSAANAASPFSANGVLAVPETEVAGDAFETPLIVPLNLFPAQALNSTVQFHVVAKIEGRLLKEAEPFAIPSALFAAYVPKSPEGAPSTNGSANPPVNDTPRSGRSGSGLGFENIHNNGDR